MTKVTIDESLRSKLNGLDDQMEFCDESGQTMGHFLPDAVYRKLLYTFDQCPYSEEELRRHMEEPGGRTLDEIWRRLGRAA
jgi:hypothetical protein